MIFYNYVCSLWMPEISKKTKRETNETIDANRSV